jgi:PAS domain S-box-containing protein
MIRRGHGFGGEILPARPSEDLPRVLKTMETLTLQGKMLPNDMRMVLPDGSVREFHTDGVVIRNGNGPTCIVGTVMDVTETRASERNAERMARFLKEAQSVANVGSWLWDSVTGKVECSDELKRILGMSQDEDLNLQNLLSRVHPEDREKARQFRDESLANAFPGAKEIRILRPDGSLRHTLSQSKRIEEPGGNLRILGTIWDITERKQLEEQLRQSRKWKWWAAWREAWPMISITC